MPIKPLNISPINTTKNIYLKCDYCCFEANIFLENSIVNIGYNGKIEESEFKEISCLKCDKIIKEI
jgi:hypothetical protein